LPPRRLSLLEQQELPPPLPRWETPEQRQQQNWPATSIEPPPLPVQEAPPAPQPRIPNLLIERQLRVISTSGHPSEAGQAGPATHNQHYHYSEAYSQAYSEALHGSFGLAFQPIEMAPEQPPAAPVAAQGQPQVNTQEPWPGQAAAATTPGPEQADDNQRRIQQLEMELEAAHGEVHALSEMLEELPSIFERKFQQRLQGVLVQQQLLIAENSSLRDRLFGLLPGSGMEPVSGRQLQLPPMGSRRRSSLADRLRRALGWQSGQESQGKGHGQEGLSRSDDGRTRVA
jgi:TolA-binding protein